MDPIASLAGDEKSSENGDWVLVDEGDLRGVGLIFDKNTSEAISLSTRSCRDEDRWETVPDLKSFKFLEILDLNNSRYITEFDASVCYGPSIKKLFLARCDRLRTISTSIRLLENLVELNFYDSPEVSQLPHEIGDLHRLKRLTFGGSVGKANKSIKAIPDSIGQLENLEELVFDQCKVLKALPSSIGNLKKLTHLRLRGCKMLEEIPASIGNCTALIEVSFAKCFNLKALPVSIQNWSQLEDLNLMKCRSLTELPEEIGQCKKLCYLNLRSCLKLEKLPESLEALPRLRFLDLAMCDSIKLVPRWLVGDSWQMEPLDLTQMVKRFEEHEQAKQE